MRLTSYQNLLWIIALLAIFCVAAPAQLLPPAASAPSVASQGTSLQPQQLSMAKSSVTGAQAVTGSGHETPTLPTKNAESGQTGTQVEEASILPDSASLLPVAAVVGFSFLLGGIVCGTIKTRH